MSANHVISLMPGNPLEVAVQRLQQKDPVGALAALDGLPAAKQDLPEALLLRGLCHLTQADAARAQAFLARAHDRKPGDPVIVQNLTAATLALAEASAAEEAAGHYEQALELDPANARALLGLAQCLQENCEFSDAAELYQAYLSQHPDDLPVLVGLGYCLQELRRPDEARAVYGKALALDPEMRPLVLKSLSTASAGSVSLTGCRPQDMLTF